MPLHRLDAFTIGVPDATAPRARHEGFGLIDTSDGWLNTAEGGCRLRLIPGPARSPMQLPAHADCPDDPSRTARHVDALGLEVACPEGMLAAVEPGEHHGHPAADANLTASGRVQPPRACAQRDYSGAWSPERRGEASTARPRRHRIHQPLHASWQVDDLDEVGRRRGRDSAATFPAGSRHHGSPPASPPIVNGDHPWRLCPLTLTTSSLPTPS